MKKKNDRYLTFDKRFFYVNRISFQFYIDCPTFDNQLLHLTVIVLSNTCIMRHFTLKINIVFMESTISHIYGDRNEIFLAFMVLQINYDYSLSLSTVSSTGAWQSYTGEHSKYYFVNNLENRIKTPTD